MTPYDELAYILRRFDMPIASMQKSVLWDDAVAALEYVIDNRRTTSAPMTETTKPVVTQADRDLFKWIIDADEEASEQIDAGLWYTHECERLAAHRLASQAVVSQDLVPVAIAREIYISGHSEGWTGNQMRRDVQHVDAQKGWELYVKNGALDKALYRAARKPPELSGGMVGHIAQLRTKAISHRNNGLNWIAEDLEMAASAIEAAQIAARNDALDEVERALEAVPAELDIIEVPVTSTPVSDGCGGEEWSMSGGYTTCRSPSRKDFIAAIRSLRTPSQHQEEQ